MPLVAGGAVDQPYALTQDILELRAYLRTKEAMERAQKLEDAPTGAMADMVTAVQYEISQEIRARRAAKRAGKS